MRRFDDFGKYLDWRQTLIKPKVLDAWDSLKEVKRQGRGQRGKDRREERREGRGRGRRGEERRWDERGPKQKGGTYISLFCRRGENDQFKSVISRLCIDWRKAYLALIRSDLHAMEIHKEKKIKYTAISVGPLFSKTTLLYGWALGEEEGWLSESLHQGFYKRFGGTRDRVRKMQFATKAVNENSRSTGKAQKAHYSGQVQCYSEIRQSQKFPFIPLQVSGGGKPCSGF